MGEAKLASSKHNRKERRSAERTMARDGAPGSPRRPRSAKQPSERLKPDEAVRPPKPHPASHNHPTCGACRFHAQADPRASRMPAAGYSDASIIHDRSCQVKCGGRCDCTPEIFVGRKVLTGFGGTAPILAHGAGIPADLYGLHQEEILRQQNVTLGAGLIPRADYGVRTPADLVGLRADLGNYAHRKPSFPATACSIPCESNECRSCSAHRLQ
jgi:hypothetical protein